MEKSSCKGFAGIGAKSRQQLAKILQVSKGPISSTIVAEVLQVEPQIARNLLSRWAKSGWVKRIKQGLYIPCSIEYGAEGAAVEDPWMIASKVFEPCYIGGWTAAHHWGFTDQLFETVVVITSRRVSRAQQKIGGIKFLLKCIVQRKYFGTCQVARDGISVEVSDEARTILDAMDSPWIVGGARMAGEIFGEFLRSEFTDVNRLLDYANRLQSATVFRRIGFFLEHYMPDRNDLLEECEKHLNSDYSQLDPKLPGEHCSKRWRLKMPQALLEEFGRG